MKNNNYNVLLVGSTGSGKSSTVNAILNRESAKVGTGADPETMHITPYKYKDITFWDTPGFGDSINKDLDYARLISNKLNEIDENGKFCIDLILVILDAGSRDLGTPYQILNTVIIPSLKQNNSNQKVIFAVNQADCALKNGKGWDYEKNIPTPEGKKYLDEQLNSIKKRLHHTTGLKIDDAVYFASGYTENGKRHKGFNIDKLIKFIKNNIPENNIYSGIGAGIAAAAAGTAVAGAFYYDDDDYDDFEESSVIDDGFEMIDNTIASIEETAESIGEAIDDITDGIKDTYEDFKETVSDIFDIFF
jgi:predicted GTPase